MTDSGESGAVGLRTAWIPAVITFMVFLPALSGRFVWDDHLLVLGAPFFHTPSMWAQALGDPLASSPNAFRPLALLSLVLDVRIAGPSPTPYHFTSLIFHLANTLIVTILAAHVYRDSIASSGTRLQDDATLVPVGAGLLFGLHPAVVEGVAYISGRFDLMMTTFLLLALLADEALQRRIVLRAFCVGVAFLLAVLCKETAAGFLLVYPAWQLVRGRARLWPPTEAISTARRNGAIFTGAAVLLGLGIYLYLRHRILGQLYLAEAGVGDLVGGGMQHLLLVARSLAEYLLLVIWPFGTLSPIHHTALPVPADDPTARAALLLSVLVIAGTALIIRRAPVRGWLLAAALVALLPATNIVSVKVSGGAYVSERNMMFALAFFALSAAGFLRAGEGALASQRLRIALAVVWALTSIVFVGRTVPYWRTDTSLWAWALRRAPLSEAPPTNLSQVYNRNGEPRMALKSAYRALDLNALNPEAWNNAGTALRTLRLYKNAERAFEQAATIDATSPLYWSNLATVLIPLGRLDEAERIVDRQVLRLNPDFAEGYITLGTIMLEQGRPDLAVRQFRQGLQRLPPGQAFRTRLAMREVQEPQRWVDLARRMADEGNSATARNAMSQARRLGAPEDALTAIETSLDSAESPEK